jgi:hypothetical protein
VAALDVSLSAEDVGTLDEAIPAGAAVGTRYREADMELISS